MTVLSVLVETLLLFVFTWLSLDLDVAVVLNTSRYGRFDRRSALDPSESVSRSKYSWNLSEEIINMRWASPLSSLGRLLGQRIWKTVQMPVKTTEAARDDHAVWM